MSVGLLVCLPHHGQANIIRGEKTNPGAVLESNEELGHCLQIKVGEEGYDVVDEIESEDFRLQGATNIMPNTENLPFDLLHEIFYLEYQDLISSSFGRPPS